MDRHPVLQSFTVDHLACMGLVVRALHQMILLLVCHTYLPLNLQKAPCPSVPRNSGHSMFHRNPDRSHPRPAASMRDSLSFESNLSPGVPA